MRATDYPATEAEIRAAFARLQALYKTDAICERKTAIEDAGKYGRGSYTKLRNDGKLEIRLGPKATIADLVHEFAHVVDRESLSAGHGSQYIKSLEDVAEKFYGDVRKYPWDDEYSHIIGYAFGKGYIASPYRWCRTCNEYHED